MTAVAIAPLGRREVVQWLAPSPLWDSGPVGTAAAGLLNPWIAELKTDTFVDDFLGLLAGTAGSPADLADLAPETTVGGVSTAPYRLFQPLSQRYYFVAAELVCRRPGIPDHVVGAGESAFFVMRRLRANGTEEGFVPGSGKTGSWLPAGAGLLDGEQRHPMLPAPVAPYAAAGSTTAALGLGLESGSGRTLFYGYIPVGVRETLARPMPDPAKKLAELITTPAPPGGWPDPIHSWLHQRVIDPWRRMLPPLPAPANPSYASLFLLLDLGDWLAQHLSTVHQAIVGGGSLTGAVGDLLDALEDVDVPLQGGGSVTLRAALAATVPFRPLVTGAEIAGPSTKYRLDQVSGLGSWLAGPTSATSLSGLARAALAVAPEAPVVPPELEGMILEREEPLPGAPAGSGTTYVIRVVYDHAPCEPVISAPTHRFELARALDADAPARKILLQMPDVTNMRQFDRGVAIELPPGLQRALDRVTPEMLKGDPMGPDNGIALGWICSFSLQIIFLVAFIVMFIFLLLLNIVFFWMPFLKICFPVPVPTKTPPGPTP
ncbi:hypothetical protein [Nocardioides sp.]|uniref:hypothetical protein n=1 Tax=Nocardioides sp. TaxID=35761 RepID=UPI002C3F5F30|nr:hypothetical protein [Nocardioides sp.]HXH78130.1 hypothetical protein [Nocardioides sp.]